MNAITEVLSSRVAGNHVIYEDESDLHLLPTLRSVWMPRGRQLRVPTPGTNQKSVFGAMDIRTGAFMPLVFDRKRAAEFIEFLEHIVARSRLVKWCKLPLRFSSEYRLPDLI